MKKAIECLAASSYSTFAFDVRPETSNRDFLVSDDGTQNKQIAEEFDRSQG
jgi:hypothetical protein